MSYAIKAETEQQGHSVDEVRSKRAKDARRKQEGEAREMMLGVYCSSVYRTSRDATVVVMSLDVADHELNAESIDKVAFRSLRHDA